VLIRRSQGVLLLAMGKMWMLSADGEGYTNECDCATVGNHAFDATTAHIWKSLSLSVTFTATLSSFFLKTS